MGVYNYVDFRSNRACCSNNRDAPFARLNERHGSKESAAADVISIDPSTSLGMTKWVGCDVSHQSRLI